MDGRYEAPGPWTLPIVLTLTAQASTNLAPEVVLDEIQMWRCMATFLSSLLAHDLRLWWMVLVNHGEVEEQLTRAPELSRVILAR